MMLCKKVRMPYEGEGRFVCGGRGLSGIWEGLSAKPVSFLGNVLQRKDMCSGIYGEGVALQRTGKKHRWDNDIVYRSEGYLKGSVVSDSMEHKVDGRRIDFDLWWGYYGKFYEKLGISAGKFLRFPFVEGLCVGDCLAVEERSPDKVEIGDVLVFTLQDAQRGGGEGLQGSNHAAVYIHRVIKKWKDSDSECYFATKGDRNLGVLSWEEIVPWTEVIGVGTGYCRQDSSLPLRLPLRAETGKTGGATLPSTLVTLAADPSINVTGESLTSIPVGDLSPPGAVAKNVAERTVGEVPKGCRPPQMRGIPLTAKKVDSVIGSLKSTNASEVNLAIQELKRYFDINSDGLGLEELEQHCRLFYLAGVYNILYRTPEGVLVSEFPEAEKLLKKTMSLAKCHLDCKKYDEKWRNLGSKYVGHISYLLVKNKLILLDFDRRANGLNRLREAHGLGSMASLGEGDERRHNGYKDIPLFKECLRLCDDIQDPEEMAKISMRLFLFQSDESCCESWEKVNKFVKDFMSVADPDKPATVTEKLVMYATYCSALEDSLSYVDGNGGSLNDRDDVVKAFDNARGEINALGGIHKGHVGKQTIGKYYITSISLRPSLGFDPAENKLAQQDAWGLAQKVKVSQLGAKGKVIKEGLIADIYKSSVGDEDGRAFSSEEIHVLFDGFVDTHKGPNMQKGRQYLPPHQQVGLATISEAGDSYQVVSSRKRNFVGFKDVVVAEIVKQSVSVQAWNAVYENFGGLAQSFNTISKGMGAAATLGWDFGNHVFLGPINVICAIITFYTRGQTVLGATKTLKNIRKVDVERATLNKTLKRIASKSAQLQTLEALTCIFGVLASRAGHASGDFRLEDINALERRIKKVSRNWAEADKALLNGLFDSMRLHNKKSFYKEGFKKGFYKKGFYVDAKDARKKSWEGVRKEIMKAVEIQLNTVTFDETLTSLEGSKFLDDSVKLNVDDENSIRNFHSFIQTRLTDAVKTRGDESDVRILDESFAKIVKLIDELKDAGVSADAVARVKKDAIVSIVSAISHMAYSGGVVTNSVLGGIGVSGATLAYGHSAAQAIGILGTIVWTPLTLITLPIATFYYSWGTFVSATSTVRAKATYSRLKAINAPGGLLEKLAKTPHSKTGKALARLQGKAGHVAFRHAADTAVFGAFAGFVAFWTAGATIALALSFFPVSAPIALVLGTVVGLIATIGFFTAGGFYYPSVFVETLGALRKNRRINLLQGVIHQDPRCVAKYRKQRIARLEKDFIVPAGVVKYMKKSKRKAAIIEYRARVDVALKSTLATAKLRHPEVSSRNEILKQGKKSYLRLGPGANTEGEELVYMDEQLRIAFPMSEQELMDYAMIELVEVSSRAALAHVFYEAKKATHDSNENIALGRRIALLKKTLAGGESAVADYRLNKGEGVDEIADLSNEAAIEHFSIVLRGFLDKRREWPEVRILTKLLDDKVDLVDEVLDMENENQAIKFIENDTYIHSH